MIPNRIEDFRAVNRIPPRIPVSRRRPFGPLARWRQTGRFRGWLLACVRGSRDMSELPAAVLNRIHHGDCIAGMNELPAGTIDLAFADPPFNIGYEYDVYDDVKEHQHYLD